MLLHGFVPASRANGPGLRAVVYFKGCSLRGLDFRETPSSIPNIHFEATCYSISNACWVLSQLSSR